MANKGAMIVVPALWFFLSDPCGAVNWREVRIEGRGHAHSMGVPGDLRVAFGEGGAYRIEVDSELPAGFGSDGRRSWIRDAAGVVRETELEEAASARLFAAVLSGEWLHDERIEQVPGDAALTLTLAGTPLRMELVLDAASGLPRELRHEQEGAIERWTFGDYREAEGGLRAHHWTFDEGAGLEEFTVEHWAPLRDPAVFGWEPSVPQDFTLDADAPAELVVERASTGHLIVQATLGGEDLGAFVFDTGAGALVLDRHVADDLGLASIGETIAVGVAGATTSSFRRGTTLELGPLTLLDPIFADLDLGFLPPHDGRPLIGIIGYDVLARCVVEIEPAAAHIALHSSGDGLPGPWSDLVLHHNHVCVSARFEGHEGLFRLDTGAGGTVTFHAPAVDALGLLEGRELLETRNGGVGGSARALTGSLAWFELAGHRFDAPTVEFSQATRGAFVDPYLAGNLGQTFLSAYRIVLDYPGDRYALVPVAD
jgi:predicted aspartyl protease